MSYHFIFKVERCKIKVALKNDMYNELEGTIAGPPDTPYAGGTFKLEIKIPETYPFNPPKVMICFMFVNVTYMRHNISAAKACLRKVI